MGLESKEETKALILKECDMFLVVQKGESSGHSWLNLNCILNTNIHGISVAYVNLLDQVVFFPVV